MSSSRTLSRKFRTFFTCIKPRFDPSIILLYIAASVEQYCDITQVNALPENEGILERGTNFIPFMSSIRQIKSFTIENLSVNQPFRPAQSEGIDI
jgi:hypothetical protein